MQDLTNIDYTLLVDGDKIRRSIQIPKTISISQFISKIIEAEKTIQ